MKKTIIILSTIFCCNLAILSAQTQEQKQISLIGLGLHIEQFKINDLTDLTTAPVNKIILSISPSQKFRIEPEFGFKYETNEKTKLKSSSLNLGIGVFAMNRSNKLNFYGGVRFEYGLISDEHFSYYNMTQYKDTDKFNRLMIGPAIGAEYFLGENFTIGGEANILYVQLSEKTISTQPISQANNSSSNYISTNTGLFLRFYF